MTSKYANAHARPRGPGDARPTALTIIKDEGLQGKLTDKVILITGCSSGIGVETARALHETGAQLFLTVRDTKKGEEVIQDILSKSTASPAGRIELLTMDLTSLQSVRDCAAEFLSKSKKLNVLILNAGIMACPEGKTKDGFELQFGTNHVGHFLFYQLLKPALLSSSTPAFNSRVVVLSSSAHHFSPVHLDDLDFKKGGYDPWKAYGQSKTANIYMATEIERRCGAQGLHAYAVHPGGIKTSLGRHMSIWDTLKRLFESPGVIFKLKSPPQGAATSVWAAVAKELEGKGGMYLEDCSIAPPRTEGAKGGLIPGHAPYAYDEAAAKKLWDTSNTLVGLPAEA